MFSRQKGGVISLWITTMATVPITSWPKSSVSDRVSHTVPAFKLGQNQTVRRSCPRGPIGSFKGPGLEHARVPWKETHRPSPAVYVQASIGNQKVLVLEAWGWLAGRGCPVVLGGSNKRLRSGVLRRLLSKKVSGQREV